MMSKQVEKLSALSLVTISAIILIDFNFNVLGANTIFSLLYVISVFFASVWISFICLLKVLGNSRPFKAKSNWLLKLAHRRFTNVSINLRPNGLLDVEERVNHLVEDIERIYIRRWYSNYISTDAQFLLESRNLLKSIILRFIHVSSNINTDKVLHGTLTILLRHVKEFRRASKRSQVLDTASGKVAKLGTGSIEEIYRYGHMASASRQNFESFAVQITSMTLHHFVHWEIYNSLACRTLAAILSRKLFASLVNLLSSPGFINYHLLMVVDPREEYKQYQNVSIDDVDHSKPILQDNVMDTCKDQESQVNHEIEEDEQPDRASTENVKPVRDLETLQGDAKPTGVPQVKVYEPRKATNKTWRNSKDLDCISLGQDILFLSNIVEEDAIKAPDWYQLAEDFKTASNLIKPIGVATAVTVKDTMKDLQASTSQAMQKIEDEAAGMVEGILDLGIAGIRKGLRLTGLQDPAVDQKRLKTDSKDIPRSLYPKMRLTKCEKGSSDDSANEDLMKLRNSESESLETNVFMNPLLTADDLSPEDFQSEHPASPNYEGDILLERSPTYEEKSCSGGLEVPLVPNLEILHVEDSPEPEYEDNIDLATTTAKLRSLLAQKTESNTPLASPMSLIPTPADASGSSVDDLSEVDGALPSMYKAWAKTATGVFQNTLNTIKTALPGNAQEEETIGIVPGSTQLCEGPMPSGQISESGQGFLTQSNPLHIYSDDAWDFLPVAGQSTINFSNVLDRFLVERQQFCMVDNAFEAMETFEIGDQFDRSFVAHAINNHKYEEELDDFDTMIPMTKALVDLVCELVEENYPTLVKESIVKPFLLTFGEITEERLHNCGKQIIQSIADHIGHLQFDLLDSNAISMAMDMEELVQPVVNTLKSTIGQWLDDAPLAAVIRLLLESLQSFKINTDTCLQIFELFIAEVIKACNQSTPA